jgi:hypothetical protein
MTYTVMKKRSGITQHVGLVADGIEIDRHLLAEEERDLVHLKKNLLLCPPSLLIPLPSTLR